MGTAFAAIFVWELLRPLRREVEGKTRRVPRNLAIAGLAALTVQIAEAPVPSRAARVTVIGVSPRGLSIWQTALLVAIMFHHSNIRLPINLERGLSRIIVTPRMHGIHHSIVPEETDSNWSSGLSIWDWLHGTIRLNVPQDTIDIGVAAYRSPDDVKLPAVLAMPFVDQPDTHRLPDGQRPERTAVAGLATRLQP